MDNRCIMSLIKDLGVKEWIIFTLSEVIDHFNLSESVNISGDGLVPVPEYYKLVCVCHK